MMRGLWAPIGNLLVEALLVLLAILLAPFEPILSWLSNLMAQAWLSMLESPLLEGSGALQPSMAEDAGSLQLDQLIALALRLLRLLSLKQQADRLRLSVADRLRLAMIDPLTGLHNRRYGLARLQSIAEAAQTSGAIFAVLVADIDQFKSVNDRFGHAVGDAVLVQVAERLRQNLRAGDLLARIGGEEFLIALPDIALAEARGLAERLCSIMSDAPFDIGQGRALPVTLSIGLAISEGGSAPAHLETITEIVDRADRALMRSKAAGRNQVTIGRSAA
jgi:two-component system cell cycle response regulator